MTAKRHVGLFLVLNLLSILLAGVTGVLAALPQRILRKQYGRASFWLAQLSMALGSLSLGYVQVAVLLLLMATLIGIYAEAEEFGAGIIAASVASIASALGLAGLLGLAYLRKMNLTMGQVLDLHLRPALHQVMSMNPGIPIDEAALIQQLPSGILILSIVSIAVGLVWERRFSRPLGLPVEPRRTQLVGFRVPDAFIWITIVAIFGAFYQHGVSWFSVVSVNSLNVLAIVYFFQGIAVIVNAMNLLKISPIWRVFWYFVFVVQLFLVVSVIGFVDYWIDFRARFTKIAKNKSIQSNRSA